jgi:hypothetical protein
MADDNPFSDPSLQAADQGGAPREELPAWATAPPDGVPPTSWSPPENDDAGAWSASPQGALHDDAADGSVRGAAQRLEQRLPQTRNGLIISMRLLNMGVSILMAAAAVIKLLSLPAFTKGVLCLYIWFFALLICCFETHLAQVSRIIAENFGFLYYVKGRIVFFVLVSFLCFSLGLIGLISGVGLLVAAAYNAYVIHKHPDYEREMLEADVEQRGPSSVYGVAGSVVAPPGRATGDASWMDAAAANPELAASVGSAAVGWAQRNPEAAKGLARSAVV